MTSLIESDFFFLNKIGKKKSKLNLRLRDNQKTIQVGIIFESVEI